MVNLVSSYFLEWYTSTRWCAPRKSDALKSGGVMQIREKLEGSVIISLLDEVGLVNRKTRERRKS